jgi:hypothetical protein
MSAVAEIELEPSPIEIDPRPCEWCGLTIDRHIMVDDGDGPDFFCADLSPEEMTLDELERRAELIHGEEIAAIIQRLELADPRDAWRHTGEAPPPEDIRNSDISGKPVSAPAPYRTPLSVIDAFRYVVALDDLERLKAWLSDRPTDAPFLLGLLEGAPSC